MKKQARAAVAKRAPKTKAKSAPKAAPKRIAKSRSHPAGVAMRKAAFGYPETVEDHPWGHSAFKAAGKKVFCFLDESGKGDFSCSLKLPFRADDALKHKFAEPTGYGLSRSGWVTFRFKASDKPDVAMLLDWLDESWRAIAPKKLSVGFAPPKRG